MNDVPSLIDLLYDSFDAISGPNEAYTLTRRVVIAPGISDGQILDATPGAADIYGRSVEEMVGNWLSLIHPIEVNRHARQMATARHYHEDVPTLYISLVLRPDGSTVPVVKDTRQFVTRGSLYWLTRVRPASDMPNLPEQQSITVPSFDDTQEIGSTRSLAEVQALLEQATQDQAPLHPFGPYASVLGKVRSNGKTDLRVETVRCNRFATNGLRLLMGRPLQRVSSGQLLAECQRCAHVWSPKKQSDILVYDEQHHLINIKISTRCGNELKRCRNWMGDFTLEEIAPLVAVVHQPSG